jgi:hypothetical protein
MRYRFPMITANLRANLAALDPCLVVPMRSLWGKTAVIACAGASIDRSRDDIAAIPETHGDRVAVYATNSASWAVRADVVVCVESLKAIRDRSNKAPLAVDAVTHPDDFNDAAHVFFKAEGAYSKLAERFNARSIAYGTSVSTAAVALAAAHGARRIILIGNDLSYDATIGRIYSEHSPLGCVRFEIEGNTLKHLNVPAGIRRPDVEVDRLGESSLYATGDFVSVAEWFEGFAELHPEIECVNATVTGMALEGWTPRSLADAMSDAPTLPATAEPFPDLDGLSIVEQVRRCRRWEMHRPEVQLYTTVAKLDAVDDARADDAIRRVVDMYRAAAKAIDGKA